jgi:hypothetical protein
VVNRTTPVTPIKNRHRSGSAIEVLLAFAKLGVSCFGGPIAHIEVARLRAAGVEFRNDTVTGPGGSQILVKDPSGNLVELFQPARR